MSMLSYERRSALTPQSAHSPFKHVVKAQNRQEMLWMHRPRRDAISVESGGTAVKENKNAMYDEEKKTKVAEQDNKEMQIKKENVLKEKDNNDADRKERQERRRQAKEAKLAAYGRKKRKDPFLGTRLSLIGLESSYDGEKWARINSPTTPVEINVVLSTEEKVLEPSKTSSKDIDIEPKNSLDPFRNLSPARPTSSLTIDVAAAKEMGDSAAVFSPAFGLLVPSRTMSSILSDISNEDASMISSRLSYQTAPVADDVGSRRSSAEDIEEGKKVTEIGGHESDPFIDSEKTPRVDEYTDRNTDEQSSQYANILPRPMTHESLASTASTTSTSILFPKRFSEVSSLGRLSTYEDAFPTPPQRLASDTISDDGTILARGSLETPEEETPKARLTALNSDRLRDKALPKIQPSVDENDENDRNAFDQDEILQASSSETQTQTRGEGDDFLYAHNAIGLLLMPAPDGPPVPPKNE